MGMLKVYLETECGMEAPVEEVEEVDAEAEAEAAKVAAARAKLMAKGAGKAGAKKKPSPPEAPKAPSPIARIPFQATTEWQEVLPHHLCPKGLQFTMDVRSGKNFARLVKA